MCHQNKYWAMWNNLKGYKSWVFFGRNDAKAETPVLWPTHAKSWLIGKDSDAGRDWGQEEKGHHQLDGHEFEWSLGVGDGQGGLACCNSWGCKESDTTERLNLTEYVLLENILFPMRPFPDLTQYMKIFLFLYITFKI